MKPSQLFHLIKNRIARGYVNFSDEGEACIIHTSGEMETSELASKLLKGITVETNAYFKTHELAREDVRNSRRRVDIKKNGTLIPSNIVNNVTEWNNYYRECYKYYLSHNADSICPLNPTIEMIIYNSIKNEDAECWSFENNTLIHKASLQTLESEEEKIMKNESVSMNSNSSNNETDTYNNNQPALRNKKRKPETAIISQSLPLIEDNESIITLAPRCIQNSILNLETCAEKLKMQQVKNKEAIQKLTAENQAINQQLTSLAKVQKIFHESQNINNNDNNNNNVNVNNCAAAPALNRELSGYNLNISPVNLGLFRPRSLSMSPNGYDEGTFNHNTFGNS